MDLKNRIPCAIMNQGKSMLIDKTSILSQNLGHYQRVMMIKNVSILCHDLLSTGSSKPDD